MEVPEPPPLLRLYHWLPRVTNALGPGVRAVVWVQGCSLACPGCMVPETWSSRGGQLVDPVALAQEILADPAIEGITVSGGEPTEQPRAVGALLSAVKSAGKNTWLYSGYTLEELLARDDTSIDALLSHVDVLVDGRYQAEQAGAYRLRGSANQRILHLTNAIPPTREGESSRVEITVDASGGMLVVGVPPPGFLGKFKSTLESRGITVDNTDYWK